MVNRSKSLTLTALAVGLASLAAGVPYAGNPEAKRLYVSHVELTSICRGLGFDPDVYTAARVKVVDEMGQPVKGARVSGTFTGCQQHDMFSANTNSDGETVIRGQVRKCRCVYTFTVTSVRKRGWAYVASVPSPTASDCLCDCALVKQKSDREFLASEPLKPDRVSRMVAVQTSGR
jgi:hypothetical protein